ncbi:hypothetical protein FE257_011786 [Aspergillus nanangensis]|uniref:Methyltransferase n=1 Tax=Aspergillus nanangensis TaxID=2582783 RepID=A0AAD4GX16_ASPNN|nr:hypothetical protein FE257_011786 [Aspergillus nanangensis]
MTTPPAQEDAPIVPEADDNLYNDAEDYGSDGASSTDSISSSILNYQYENGRRYHAYQQGEYMLPNDEREQERMDLHHHVHCLALGGALHHAPIKKGVQRILDLGTGNGTWAIDIADLFPEATVVGTDLSPIQPSWVPPNCVFEIDDFELDWNFTRPFDYIHTRGIEGSVKDFPRLFEQAHNALSPGGWFECQEFTIGVYSDDNSEEKATGIYEWKDHLIEGSKKFGKIMGMAPKYKQMMEDTGFKNVQQTILKVPFSPWAKDPKMKELGRYQQANMLEALDAYSLALFTRVLGWRLEDVQMLLVRVRKDLLDRSLHIYARFYLVYGQKE